MTKAVAEIDVKRREDGQVATENCITPLTQGTTPIDVKLDTKKKVDEE
jgi:hypothetical protein